MNTLFNDNWRFLKTEFGVSFDEIKDKLDLFEPVDIPHDWLIWNTLDLYETSTGWYVKDFELEQVSPSAFIRFDGVYMDSTVYINGEKAFSWAYGYSTFTFNATKYLKAGKNQIIVQVNYQSPNTRWYSGAGIFRDIHFIEKNDNYILPDGVYVHSEPVGKNHFKVRVEVEVVENNDTPTKLHVDFTGKNDSFVIESNAFSFVGDAWEVYIKRQHENNANYDYEGIEGMQLPTFAKYKMVKVFAAEIIVNKPDIWDISCPNLYRVSVLLNANELAGCPKDTAEDVEEFRIGFKKIEFDKKEGLFLNDKHIKIYGACEHHDLGCLGAAFHKDAMRRKLSKLRKMGINSIRTSHNMPDPKFLDLCDEMGFLVIDEAFDMWLMAKTEYDYARFFKEWSHRDVESWVKRDRNRASVYMWSIGNEIPDTANGDLGPALTAYLCSQVRTYDPYSNAYTTIGSNHMQWDKAQVCAQALDVQGYNYLEKLYDEHRKKYRNFNIYGSETASIVNSRGVYHFPLSAPIMAEEDEQCSALGNSTSSWGAKSFEKLVYIDRDTKHSLGQYIWSGFDYIGEPTPYHTKNSYFGAIDTAGFYKDLFYALKAEWTVGSEESFVHVFPYWDFNEGQMIDIRVCSNLPTVDLYVNGVSMGRKNIDHTNGTELIPTWTVPYHKGYIEAIGYDMAGNVVAKDRHNSFGDSYIPVVSVEEHARYSVRFKPNYGDLLSDIVELSIVPDGREIYFVDVATSDENGNLVENAMDYVSVTAENAIILGMDNGDSTDWDQYKTNKRKLFNGKLLVMVKPCGEGDIVLNIALCKGKNGRVPVRKLEIINSSSTTIEPSKNDIPIEVKIYPENASDSKVKFKIVNAAGIELDYAKVEEASMRVDRHGVKHTATVKALGDGEFYLRAISTSDTDTTKIISQLEFKAEGFGYCFVNPYNKQVSAGLYDSVFGDVGSGNSKGISTAFDEFSGAVYKNIDFGSFGSDEITLGVFTFSQTPHYIYLYEGDPNNGGELIEKLYYCKPSIWNTYLYETWKLPKRLKGLKTLTLATDRQKLHIEGFQFKKLEKAYCDINASEYDMISGDSYEVSGNSVKNIGNNVSVGFADMDFGDGCKELIIRGTTVLESMPVRLYFVREDGEHEIHEVSIKGNISENRVPITLMGKGRVEFIFLPGTKFDFDGFTFIK